MQKFQMSIVSFDNEGETWIALVMDHQTVDALATSDTPALSFNLEQARSIHQALGEVIEEVSRETRLH